MLGTGAGYTVACANNDSNNVTRRSQSGVPYRGLVHAESYLLFDACSNWPHKPDTGGCFAMRLVVLCWITTSAHQTNKSSSFLSKYIPYVTQTL
jgi:hypothetical protein